MSTVQPIRVNSNQIQAKACGCSPGAEHSCQKSNELSLADMTKHTKLNKRWHRRFKILSYFLGYKKNKVSFDDKIQDSHFEYIFYSPFISNNQLNLYNQKQ